MYCADEKGRKCKYPKITAASAQNDDFYCKKWSFALLLLTNPLPLTIIHNISMGATGIGCLLSLTLGWQRVIIMVISMILVISVIFLVKHDVMQQNHRKFEIQSSVIFHPPWETPSFLLLHTMLVC
jgi:hypothetical protein